ncbi:hypothetical protein V2J09_005413 [Rumex salicifolius]
MCSRWFTIQGEEEEGKEDSDAFYLPTNLKNLQLVFLSKLKGWWIVAAASASTWPLLSLQNLRILYCPQLIDTLLCPNLHFLELGYNKLKEIQLFRGISIQPSSLQHVNLEYCLDLVSFPGESLTSLRRLCIDGCTKLNKVELAPLGTNILETLEVSRVRVVGRKQERCGLGFPPETHHTNTRRRSIFREAPGLPSKTSRVWRIQNPMLVSLDLLNIQVMSSSKVKWSDATSMTNS